MKTLHATGAALALLAASLAHAASGAATPAASAPAGNQPEPVIMLVPVEVSTPALDAGCWVQLYSERNFKGDMLTLVGPVEFSSLDKSSGRELKRDIDSLVVGPKATLTVYEHQLFKDRSVQFQANAREGGLIKRLGFGGRIQSLRLSCAR